MVGRKKKERMLAIIIKSGFFRLDVGCQFDLDKISKRIHILEGRMILTRMKSLKFATRMNRKKPI
jgi:hypothetical protein